MSRINRERRQAELEEWNHIRELNQKWNGEPLDKADTPDIPDITEDDDEQDSVRE